MNQQSSWQPQEPSNGQHRYGQQQWKQHLPHNQPSFYTQSTQPIARQFLRPAVHHVLLPKRPSGIWQWYTSRTKKVKLAIGCSAILAVLLFYTCIGTAIGGFNLVLQAPPTPTTSTHQTPLLMITSVPTHPTPTLAPSVTPTPQPATAPTSVSQPTTPSPTSTPCPGINCNPWGYNFLSGRFIYSPPSAFCTYFTCINKFFKGQGYVVECQDGKYSKSGGVEGACAPHGGVMRPLYAHSSKRVM